MESKGHKDRIVMMTDDVTELLRQYHKQVSRIMPGQELFFPNSQGHLYTKRWIEKTFRIMWIKPVFQYPPKSRPEFMIFVTLSQRIALVYVAAGG